MANYYLCSLVIHDSITGPGKAPADYLERLTRGGLSLTVHPLGTIEIDDIFTTGGEYEIVGQSRNDSIENIVGYLRLRWPDADIEASVTIERVL